MAGVKRPQRTLTELKPNERKRYIDAWRASLDTNDDSQRTLNLHAVICEAHELRSKHIGTCVDAALAVVFPLISTRARLQRLHEIPKESLEKAMKIYQGKKAAEHADTRSSPVLTTSHLEALARCVDARKRQTLLKECATNVWTATVLRKMVVPRQTGNAIKPLKLAKQVRVRADQLIKVLSEVEAESLIDAVDRVKKRDRDAAIGELDKAVESLKLLKGQIDGWPDTLKSASKKLRGKAQG